MRRAVFVLLMISLFAICISAEAADVEKNPDNGHAEYTLEDLYRIALSRSERIKISEEDLFIAERYKDKSMSFLLPRLSAFGEHMRFSEEKTSSVSAGSFTIQPKSSSSWGLRLNQSISLGGREITSFRISKKMIESSRYDLYAVREDYVLKVSESYYDVLKAKKGVDIARANVERLLKYRDEANTRLRVGEVSKTAVLRAEGELSGARSELTRSENLLKLAKVVLARVAGISGSYEIKETEYGGQNSPDIGKLDPLDFIKETAFTERAEIRSVGIQKDIAEDSVSVAKGSYWPSLSLEGVYMARDENSSSSFLNDESMYGLLRVDLPLFEGGLRRAEVRTAEAKKRQAEFSLDDLKKNISIEVEGAYLELKTQAGILDSLEDQLRFARDNYDAVTKQFAFGLASSIDVIDANTLLVDSERQLSRAQYNYQLAALRLKRAKGTLLKEVNGKP